MCFSMGLIEIVLYYIIIIYELYDNLLNKAKAVVSQH